MIKTLAAKLPRLALALSILLPFWFLLASLGAKFGWWGKMTGFGTMTAGIGVPASMALAGLAAVALALAIFVKPRPGAKRGWVAALIALAIPLGVLAGFAQLRAQAQSLPLMYDITTDAGDPPLYSAAMMQARAADDANGLIDFSEPLGAQEKWATMPDLADTLPGTLIAEGYPGLAPLELSVTPETALAAIAAAMETHGFDNVSVDQASGQVEATDELFWYGFRDDIVARVRPAVGGSIVDFRSTSRLGLSDLGVNAGRIEDLRQAVIDRVAAND